MGAATALDATEWSRRFAVAGVRPWLSVIRASTQKELRDLAWLAFALAISAALAVAAIAETYDLVLPLFQPSERGTLLSVAMLMLVPLGAESLCADERNGFARWRQGTPASLSHVAASKALALILHGALFVLVLLVSTAALYSEERHAAFSDVLSSIPWTRSVPIAGLLAATLAAAVTRHSLASLLAGAGALSTHAALLVHALTNGTPSIASGRAVEQYIDATSAPLGYLTVGLMLASLALLLRLRGRMARSVASRFAVALLSLLGVAALCFSRTPAGETVAALAPFDDEGARVTQLLPSPDGARLALELTHGLRGHGRTWWALDLESEAPPKRLSTPQVARATALGLRWRVHLSSWTPDGTSLIGWSAPGSTWWSLAPHTLEVTYPRPQDAVAALEDVHRRKLAGGTPVVERARRSERELGFERTTLLPDGRWITTSSSGDLVTLHAADGSRRTVRAPRARREP